MVAPPSTAQIDTRQRTAIQLLVQEALERVGDRLRRTVQRALKNPETFDVYHREFAQRYQGAVRGLVAGVCDLVSTQTGQAISAADVARDIIAQWLRALDYASNQEGDVLAQFARQWRGQEIIAQFKSVLQSKDQQNADRIRQDTAINGSVAAEAQC